MSTHLPPLNALRAFVAAAHHLSFTRAAKELNVTPAAVSHQVKALEEFIGAPLFTRLTRALRLTDRGQAALPKLSEGFDLLADGAKLMAHEQDENVLIVTATPSFGGQWLVPRLIDFQDAYPDIKIRIDASVAIVDLRRDGIDVAIRWGSGEYPGHAADRLFEDEVFPVCSPKLMTGLHPLKTPQDLVHHTLLHSGGIISDVSYAEWPMWLELAGADQVDWRKGPEFSLENMAVQAAVEGHGVALVNTSLVRDELASGRLIQPFEEVIPTDFAYYLVVPNEYRDRLAISAFRTWLLQEVTPLDAA
jgi:LysR family transcriptional regulator, glycine cleavage system transcriptional activator